MMRTTRDRLMASVVLLQNWTGRPHARRGRLVVQAVEEEEKKKKRK